MKPIHSTLFLPIVLLLFSSCASLLYVPTKTLVVDANVDSVAVVQPSLQTLQWQAVPFRTKVTKKEPLSFYLPTDTGKLVLPINRQLSSRFLFGNLVMMPYAPVGYLIDFLGKRLYTYPKHIYLRAPELSRAARYNSYLPTRANDFSLHAGFTVGQMPLFETIPLGVTAHIGLRLDATYTYSPSSFFGVHYFALRDAAVLESAMLLFPTSGYTNHVFGLAYGKKYRRWQASLGMDLGTTSAFQRREEPGPNGGLFMRRLQYNHLGGSLTLGWQFRSRSTLLFSYHYYPLSWTSTDSEHYPTRLANFTLSQSIYRRNTGVLMRKQTD